jgi:hypothetical protein
MIPKHHMFHISLQAGMRLRVPSAAMLSGIHGGILKFLGVEVQRVCDGSQEMSSRVVGGHSTAVREVESNKSAQSGREIGNKVSLGLSSETVSLEKCHGMVYRRKIYRTVRKVLSIVETIFSNVNMHTTCNACTVC